MVRDQVDKIVKRIHELPTLPFVYKRVSDLLRNPYTSASDIAAVIAEDQVITTKLLRLVNSAHYGFPEKVETVSRAVSLVGMKAVKDLILATSVMDLFHSEDVSNFTISEFWRHSLGVAVTSSSIARYVDPAQMEEYFVAGLIHDIGKIVWVEHFQVELFEVLALARSKRIPMVEAEQAHLNFTHARAGRMLAKRWGLPERLVETVAWHHDPKRAERHPSFAAVVHIADSFANAMHLGRSGNGCVPPIQPEALESCDLKVSDMDGLLEAVVSEYEDSLLLLSFWDEDEKEEVEASLQDG